MEELDKRWEVKTVVQVVIRALWVVTPKLGELLKQIPGTASTFCSDTTIVGTAKNLQAPSARHTKEHTEIVHKYTYIHINSHVK